MSYDPDSRRYGCVGRAGGSRPIPEWLERALEGLNERQAWREHDRRVLNRKYKPGSVQVAHSRAVRRWLRTWRGWRLRKKAGE